MATTTSPTTLTSHQRAVRSTVATKVVMAVTGLVLIGFLLAHMLGNLKLFIPAKTTNGVTTSEFSEYSHLLRRLFYPVFPEHVFLWLFRLFLILCAVLHIWSAVKLKGRNDRNTGGGKRYTTQRTLTQSFAARTMIWGGIIIVLFLILHLLQFTITPQIFDSNYTRSNVDMPRLMVLNAFKNPLYVLVYLVAMAAVCMHVWHGFWAAFATLGANVSVQARRVLKACATIVALALFVGFMISPLAVLFGVVK